MEAQRATFNIPEVARATGLNEKSVRQGIAKGEIPALHVGRRILVPAWWIRQQLEGPNATSASNSTPAPA